MEKDGRPTQRRWTRPSWRSRLMWVLVTLLVLASALVFAVRGVWPAAVFLLMVVASFVIVAPAGWRGDRPRRR